MARLIATPYEIQFMTASNNSDFLIVGGGIVGLATAWRLMQQFPDAKIMLLEKEGRVGTHQSGRNSGVLHSGIYYKPGSLKAVTCRSGKVALEQFCREHGVRYETCGKIIVALDETELPGLEHIFKRGVENGVTSHWLDAFGIRELEPHSAGIRGLHVPEAGIVDYPAVCAKLSGLLVAAGHSVKLHQQVTAIRGEGQQVTVSCGTDQFTPGFW